MQRMITTIRWRRSVRRPRRSFVQCRGAAVLEEAGIEVSVIGDLAAEAMLANAHIRL
ncbi:MAG: hypothetical protein ACLUEV_11215 [Alistipes sp.]